MFLNYFALGVLIFVFLVIFLWDYHYSRYSLFDRQKTQPPSFRCYSCRRMGQSFYSPRHMAVFMDLGHVVPA